MLVVLSFIVSSLTILCACWPYTKEVHSMGIFVNNFAGEVLRLMLLQYRSARFQPPPQSSLKTASKKDNKKTNLPFLKATFCFSNPVPLTLFKLDWINFPLLQMQLVLNWKELSVSDYWVINGGVKRMGRSAQSWIFA